MKDVNQLEEEGKMMKVDYILALVLAVMWWWMLGGAMSYLIAIVIWICVLFVVWTLLRVGADGDEDMRKFWK